MNDTLLGSLFGGLVVLVGSVLTYLATRGKDRATATLTQAELDQRQRSTDINFIVDNLKEQVANLTKRVDEGERENRECWADRDQMRGKMQAMERQLNKLERESGGV